MAAQCAGPVPLTSGMSSRGCLTASSKMARARSMSPSTVSSSANPIHVLARKGGKKRKKEKREREGERGKISELSSLRPGMRARAVVYLAVGGIELEELLIERAAAIKLTGLQLQVDVALEQLVLHFINEKEREKNRGVKTRRTDGAKCASNACMHEFCQAWASILAFEPLNETIHCAVSAQPGTTGGSGLLFFQTDTLGQVPMASPSSRRALAMSICRISNWANSSQILANVNCNNKKQKSKEEQKGQEMV
jgi:hypothetical protein